MQVSAAHLSQALGVPLSTLNSPIYMLTDYDFSGYADFGGMALTKELWPRVYTPEWADGLMVGRTEHAFDPATHSLMLKLTSTQFAAFVLRIVLTPGDIVHTRDLRSKVEYTLPSTRVQGFLGANAGQPVVAVCMLDHSLVVTDTRRKSRLAIALPVELVRQMDAFAAR
jgi:hypothetical protein